MTKPVAEVIAGLVDGFYPQYGAPGSRDVDVSARRKIVDEVVALVLAHIREMESLRVHLNQVIAEEGGKAVRAEAQLKELAEQKPYGYEYVTAGKGHVVMSRVLPPVDMREVIPLFTRAAPASGSAESSCRQSTIQLPQGEYAYINGVGMRVLPFNSTLAAIERAGYTATEAPL